MSLFSIYETAHNGLKASRGVMEIASDNVANMLTPGYKAKKAILSARGDNASFSEVVAEIGNHNGVASLIKGKEGRGAQIAEVTIDQRAGVKVYMPGHPLADENGNVEMSNVDGANEMITMMDAVRQYKANLSIVEMAKKASQEALNMTKNS
jgi:flagellar basal-body rod protein FlgC